MIEMQNIKVNYPNGFQPLKKIDLTFDSGKLYGIIGPSGSGKSSLIKSILDLVPYTGKITYKGKEIKKNAREIAYVEQKENIDRSFPITVFQCVLLGSYPRLGLFKRPGTVEMDSARAALKKVNMYDFRDRQIGELSGGQFQRMLIARTLVQNAELMLLDEPFVGIDVKNEAVLIQHFKELTAQGKTILMVHHDLSKAKEYFDEIVLVNKKIIAFGPSEEVMNRENIKQAYDLLSSIEEV